MVVGRRRRRPPRSSRRVRDGGGKLLRDVRVFDLYRGEQVGEGRKSLALRLEFRAPDRTLTDEEVAERRAAIERSELGARSGGGCRALTPEPRVAVDRRRRLRRRALRAHRAGAPVARADRRHRAHATPAAATTSSTRATACRSTLEEFDPDAIAEQADAALVAYPHKAAAPAVEALRERGLKVVDLSADFRLDQAALRALVPAARGARAAGRVGLRPARAGPPRRDPRRRASSPGRAATRPPRCWRSGRCASTIARRRRRHQVGRLGRRARAHARDPLRLGGRERQRLQGRGPPPPRRARAGAARRHPRSRSCRTCSRSTRACSPAATSRPSEPLTHGRGARAVRGGLRATSRSSSWSDAPPRHARRAARPTAPRPRDACVGDRVLAFAAIDNLWKGAAGQAVQDLNLMLGLPETEGLT